jgi:hypothetical protein
MLERGVGDEGKVVELQNVEILRGAGCHTQLSDPFICDELAVREADRFEEGTARGQDGKGCIGDLDAFFQIDLFQVDAISGQGLEAGVRELGYAGALEGGQTVAVV